MTRAIVIALLLSPLYFIRWSVIPYTSMRYPTPGDWKWGGRILRVTSARLSRRRYEWLILVHETVEALLCSAAGVREESVTEYDTEYEAVRSWIARKGEWGNFYTTIGFGCDHKIPISPTSEPGDDPAAPYHRQHRIATSVERLCARLFFVNWAAYTSDVESL